jgi:aromatic ring-opening dioxygenase catalytic subunit (LigB family)
MPERLPSAYITHGGGPCFFMDWDPPDAWDALRSGLESVGPSLPAPPTAIVVVSAHWESDPVTVDSGASPGLIYDYGGFPPETYELRYPAPGSPEVAARVASLLAAAGIEHRCDPDRGWDHGVFIPLKVMFPDADVPIVAMSLHPDLDPARHLAIGRALAPLRDEGVLLVGSGSSFHHFSHWGSPLAEEFDRWLAETLTSARASREAALVAWEEAPHARHAHGREEHLLPLMVAAGAANDVPARPFFQGSVMDTPMSCWFFD